MIEFLKLLVDIASKAISGLGTRHDKKRMSDIGAELFMFYIQVNEALVAGYAIVKSLEFYVESMDSCIAGGGDPDAFKGRPEISHRLQVQRDNLARIGETMQRWGRPLQILDGEACAQIAPLLHGKMNALDALLRLLGEGNLPITMTLEQLLALGHSEESSGSQMYRRLMEFEENATNGAVSLGVPWGGEIHKRVKLYLETRNPRRQLDEIRHNLERIREALDRNFTITDILLRVGDERFSLKYDGDYFW